MLRVGIVAVPIVASFTTALTLSSVTAVPTTFGAACLRWLMIAAAATVVLVAAERLTRRLVPMATLLALSLTFPDRAPPRFRIALRNGSTRQLKERIAEARRGELGGTPAEAAERVLELVAALSLHDRRTRGHSERVRAYSRLIGEELGLDDAELDHLQWAGLLHDVGKLLIPESILNKPGRLTPAEYEEVCKHPDYGHAMVMPLIPWLGDSARAVWEHHERWDGGGYPAGLAGFDIALAARIVNVADTFDVMTSTRSYKEPVSAAESRAELARCAGGQFDPEIVRAFLNISIGRLRLVMGPISWIAQVPLFPTSVLTGAVGGNAATFAATLAVVGVTTLGPLNLVDPSTTEASVLRGADGSGYVTESPGLAVIVAVVPPAVAPSTTTGPSGSGHSGDQVQFAESNLAMGLAPTTATSSPTNAPAVIVAPTGVRLTPIVPVGTVPPTPGVTLPSAPVLTVPALPGVTVPTLPGVTTPSVPVVISPTPTTTVPRAPFVQLGAATNFAVLASAAVTSTGPTAITGNVGNTAAAITGLLTMNLGEIFEASPTTGAAAQADAAAAHDFLSNLTASPLPVDLGGRTISPGVYAGGTIELTGSVVLDAGGDPNAVFVLKAASTLVTASSSRVVLVNGAQACNVFWQVGSSATFGTGTAFAGTVIATTSITATTGTTLDGRLLALNGAVTLDSNTIEIPACD